MKDIIQKIKCKLGFHSPKEIGRAPYPYDVKKNNNCYGMQTL